MSKSAMVLILISAYALVLFYIGYRAKIQTSKTPEDYFMANRGLGFFVLIFAVFGTNMTAFYMMGIPGQAYNVGFPV